MPVGVTPALHLRCVLLMREFIVTVPCAYCGEPCTAIRRTFAHRRPRERFEWDPKEWWEPDHCSTLCLDRLRSWETWIRNTRRTVTRGDVNHPELWPQPTPLPPVNRSLAEALTRNVPA